MKYNHNEYGKDLFDSLNGMKTFVESTFQDDPLEMEEKLKKLVSPVFIAISDNSEDINLKSDGAAYTKSDYAFMILKKDIKPTASSIRKIQAECKAIIREVASKIFLDCDDDLIGSLSERGLTINICGPYGDNLYGAMVSFSIENQQSYELNNEYWK